LEREFAFYLQARRNLSKITVLRHIQVIGTLVRKYGVNLQDLSEEAVYELKNEMLDMGMQNSYINKVLITCKHFIGMQGIDVKFKVLKETEKPVDYLNHNELKLLFTATKEESDKHLRLRDRAIMAAAVFSAIRRTEIQRLRRRDVNIDRREITIRDPKNKVPDIAVIPKLALRIWEVWLEFRDSSEGYDGKSDLFLNS
jgi:integrase